MISWVGFAAGNPISHLWVYSSCRHAWRRRWRNRATSQRLGGLLYDNKNKITKLITKVLWRSGMEDGMCIARSSERTTQGKRIFYKRGRRRRIT